MATLVLSTVGQTLFGPVGGAIGAIIGQQVDNAVFGSSGREGPRLNDLRLQTSSYGTPLPRIFGTMRVAGTVVWATDLREDRNREGGGKGRPSSTTYSYSASFAVALSARPIRAVRRIWADGKLLRGVAGDLKTETEFRTYLGTEDQAIDPLLSAAEGLNGTPAYRGLALAIFENCQLADFGNRIPSLTFEVVADEGEVSVADILVELGAGAISAQSNATLSGFAAHGESVRAVVETLTTSLPHYRRDATGGIFLSDEARPIASLGEPMMGARRGEQGDRPYMLERDAIHGSAREIVLRYYEPSRDYQAGVQRAWIDGSSRTTERIDLPATLSARRAKAIAEARLERYATERERLRVPLPYAALEFRPGDRIEIPRIAGSWRVVGLTLEAMVVSLDLVRASTASALIADTAASGRSVTDPDREHGPTRIALLDIPALGDELHVAPRIMIAAAGVLPGWRSASLELSFDGGASFQSFGQTAPPAVMGHAIDSLADGQAAILDRDAAVEIELLHPDMWLTGANDLALSAGANLAVLGDELFQFGRAEPLGEKRFRLSHLARGRRGTEWATVGHCASEPFVLIDFATLKSVEAPTSAIGGAIECVAIGLGDADEPVTHSLTLRGHSVRPPAPVHLAARRMADTSIKFTWVRRSRLGWTWPAAVEIPLGEERELWRVTVEASSGAGRTIESTAPTFVYSAGEQMADGTDTATEFTLSVSQVGAIADSATAARATFSI